MYRLELRSITKRYHGVAANEDIHLAIEPGEIHAVLGENGAGKSTLMKIIYGAVQADAGTLLWEGHPVTIDSPAAARRLGIGMVYQHFSLFETVTVAENIAVALDVKFDLAALSARIRELGARYGLEVDPARLVHHLSVGERQRVEILRCLLQNPRLLILDEPTAVLAPPAALRLFEVLRRLAADGCTILYITHRLEEIRGLCRRATVLRSARVVATLEVGDTTSATLARLMVGRDPPVVVRGVSHRDPAPRLEAHHLSGGTDDPYGVPLRDVSLAVHGGEILGIAGVSGNGQRELVALLCGERQTESGAIRLDGVPVGELDVAARRRRGLAFVPEDRLGTGAVPDRTLADNALLTTHAYPLVRRGWVDRAALGRYTRDLIGAFGVRCTGAAALARSLSGGNLQKFIVGRELRLGAKALIVAQPTWGVDVAAAAFLRQQLIDTSRAGAAVLVVSEEIEELFEICDRVAVIHAGCLSAARPVAETSVEAIGLLMTGVGVDRAA